MTHPPPCRCGCGRVPQGRRRNWFSQECVDQWLLANRQQVWRDAIYARDKGVCRVCGIDCEALRRAACLAWGSGDMAKARDIVAAHPGLELSRSYWQADHIHPRYKGGKNTLENGQTLCLPCHKLKTNSDRGAEWPTTPPETDATTPPTIEPEPVFWHDPGAVPKLRHIEQPRGSHQCGQTCVAILLNMGVDEVCRAMGWWTGTTPKMIALALRKFGHHPTNQLTLGTPPPHQPVAMLKMRWRGSKETHWVLKHHGSTYDPGEPRPNADYRICGGYVSSFLAIEK